MPTTARGVFAIPPTPFSEDGALDEESLRRTVQFCLSAGVHGLVTPVNASEFTALTDDERRRVVRTIELHETPASRDLVSTSPSATKSQRQSALEGIWRVIRRPSRSRGSSLGRSALRSPLPRQRDDG